MFWQAQHKFASTRLFLEFAIGGLGVDGFFLFIRMKELEILIWKTSPTKEQLLTKTMFPRTIETIVGEGILEAAISNHTEFKNLAELIVFASQSRGLTMEPFDMKQVRIVTPILLCALYELISAHLEKSNIIESEQKDFL